MHVTDVKAGAVAAEPARTERRQSTLVRQLGKRIGLIHELRKLAATEELTHGGHHRPSGADQAVRRDRLDVLNGHSLADASLQPLQAGSHVHLNQLADRPDAPVAEMVNVVRLPLSAIDPDQLANDGYQIFRREYPLVEPGREPQALVELVPADLRQIVATGLEEESVEQVGRVVLGRRVTRPQAAVELDLGLFNR